MIDPLGEHAWLLLIVLGGFLVDWLAVACGWHKLKPLTKTAAMLTLIFWTLTAGNWQLDPLAIILFGGQLFGLAGDIFLLFSARFFIWGLLSFLIGHVFYLSLSARLILEQLRVSWSGGVYWYAGLSAGVWFVMLACFYIFFGSAYKQRHAAGLLWVGIQIYAWILSGLVILNLFLSFIPPVFSWISLCLPFGAALFLLSDSLLATNRFLSAFRLAQLWVRITYHLGQLLLAVGFLASA